MTEWEESRRTRDGDEATTLDRPLGEVVRAWRADRRLDPSELANRSGLSRSYISEVEHGRIARPGPSKMNRLAESLGTSAENLLLRRLPSEVTDHPEPAAGGGIPQPERKGLRFRSSPVTVKLEPDERQEEVLRDILRHVDAIRRAVEELLPDKENEEEP